MALKSKLHELIISHFKKQGYDSITFDSNAILSGYYIDETGLTKVFFDATIMDDVNTILVLKVECYTTGFCNNVIFDLTKN